MDDMSWYFILVGSLAFVVGAGGARRRDDERAERIWGFVAGTIVMLPLIWGAMTYQPDQAIYTWSDGFGGETWVGPEKGPSVIVRIIMVGWAFIPAFFLAFCAPFLSRLMIAVWNALERGTQDFIDRNKD